MGMRYKIYCLLLTACCLLSWGCGYKIQSISNLSFDAIAIGKIENRTLEPRLQDRLSRALAERFMQYGCKIDPHARYKIEGEITGFEINPVAEKAVTAIQYIVIARADFKLIDTIDGSVMTFSIYNPFSVYFSSAGSLQEIIAQKEIAAGRALDDLSQEVVRRIIYNELRDFKN